MRRNLSLLSPLCAIHIEYPMAKQLSQRLREAWALLVVVEVGLQHVLDLWEAHEVSVRVHVMQEDAKREFTYEFGIRNCQPGWLSWLLLLLSISFLALTRCICDCSTLCSMLAPAPAWVSHVFAFASSSPAARQLD